MAEEMLPGLSLPRPSLHLDSVELGGGGGMEIGIALRRIIGIGWHPREGRVCF
jgi:hypothetical protein